MKFSVSHRLYNSFGGHKSISLVADWLEYENSSFGDAIDEIEITIHFYHDGPARKSLEKRQEEFHKNLKTLPKSSFYRKKKRITLDIEGKFTTGYEIEKQRKPPIQIKPEWVRSALATIIEALPVIKAKIKSSDDFKIDEFESFLRTKLDTLPTSTAELESVSEMVSTRRKARYEKLDDWEKLGIDWDEFHANARDLVPIPFQWSVTDEFAPNGNDTGADTLRLFKEWNKENKSKSSIEFLSKLLRDWNVDVHDPYVDEYTTLTYFQAAVGLAFATAKIRGECDSELKALAISAIDKYLSGIANESSWRFKSECESKLSQCKSTLEKWPNNTP